VSIITKGDFDNTSKLKNLGFDTPSVIKFRASHYSDRNTRKHFWPQLATRLSYRCVQTIYGFGKSSSLLK